MGLFDWLGPLNAGAKRRGWGDLPAPEQKYSWTINDQRAVIRVPSLVHGPGATELLDGTRGMGGNSAVYACLEAICSAYVEAPLTVYRQTSPKDREPLFDSPLQTFLDDPNPDLDMLEIMAWVQWAKHVDGNAYLRKIRSGNELTGNVVELWPVSPSHVEVKSSPGEFISYYRYWWAADKYDDIPPENMVHNRMGIDDRDHRVGYAPLKQLVREVSSDDEATAFADALLKNFAVPGLIVQMEADPTLDQAEQLKQKIATAFGSGNRGNVGVLGNGATMTTVGWSPEQLDLKVLHRIPEERIAAVLRVPAIVAGLGAGLDRSTFANYAEANEAFIEKTILNLYRRDDKRLTKSLVPDFKGDGKTIIAHDISQMRALQDDEDAKATRLQIYVAAGILDVDEARAEIGREPRPLGSPAAGAEAPDGLPSAVRSRAPLILVRKSLDDLPAAFDRLRDEREPDWHDQMTRHLEAMQRRIDSRLRSGHDTAEGLVGEVEGDLLGERLRPLQTALLSDVHGLVLAELGVTFQLDDPLTRAYLEAAGVNIRGITDATREAVRAALIEGQANGEGIAQLARRLRDLPEFGPGRARTVARTELGHSANTAALTNYRASGVVLGLRVFDGDYDAQCAAMNGRTFPLDQPPATLQHPNCRRALAPIVDVSELEQSA